MWAVPKEAFEIDWSYLISDISVMFLLTNIVLILSLVVIALIIKMGHKP